MACDLHISFSSIPDHNQSYGNERVDDRAKNGAEGDHNEPSNQILYRIVETKRSQRGQTMTEYVLIIAAIAVAGYVAYQGLETGINGIITKVTASLNAA